MVITETSGPGKSVNSHTDAANTTKMATQHQIVGQDQQEWAHPQLQVAMYKPVTPLKADQL